MNAQELFMENGISTHFWRCSKCKAIYETQKRAEDCCEDLIVWFKRHHEFIIYKNGDPIEENLENSSPTEN